VSKIIDPLFFRGQWKRPSNAMRQSFHWWRRSAKSVLQCNTRHASNVSGWHADTLCLFDLWGIRSVGLSAGTVR
jgi:hypothetical protein